MKILNPKDRPCPSLSKRQHRKKKARRKHLPKEV